ncbi:Latent-transforming growth factor beta-binding protein 2 [Lonchura striata]|uniref:Latent-transforming growth factor beta-binding protein 1 n=1 Tax=Lonchura striata TaxID=40157 RepID=A0A218VEP0_9PASE|nr:Latent-transforming growth factor beta-binding protein 2 [Lonchura striata domestica]
MAGPNVCGRQCCPGWTTAPGTNHCIKPVCDPPCQNKGSCSRPQVCTCRSGFQGFRCEEVVPEQEYHPPGAAAAFQPPSSSLRRRTSTIGRDASLQGPQAPIPRHIPAVIQSRIGSPVSPQHTGSSRTVRRYPASNAQLTSNALPNGNGHEQSRSGPHAVSQEHTLSAKGANLTEKIRKIKIVFTPTICKQTCQSGRCYNSCEKGDTTTLYSQGGHDHDPKSGFRIYFCQIPCLNGGRCVGRDECWCPSNSTGKFCHLPAPSLEKKQAGSGPKPPAGSSMRHSTYTLPLSNQLASLNPSLVNVHINHPPEAIVQIHQVARVRGDAEASEENSVEAVLVPQLAAVPWYTYSHGNGNSIATESRQQQQRTPGLLGRCFREAVHGQCTNPLPGLTKLEDCCGSVGLFWGMDQCLACPPRPAHPVIENGQVECPQGYKRLNRSHCQDINECLMQGLCKDAECMNTRGSFRCTCKPGTMLDPSRSHCISEEEEFWLGPRQPGPTTTWDAAAPTQVPAEKPLTYRSCPSLGPAAASQGSLAGRGESRTKLYGEQGAGVSGCASSPLSCGAGACVLTPEGYSCLCHPGYTLGSSRLHCIDEDECLKDPCAGKGRCINSVGSYFCLCYSGYTLAVSVGKQSCEDRDECEQPSICRGQQCINTPGSYHCQCKEGFAMGPRGQCEDVNECVDPSSCPSGRCVNTLGSYKCVSCAAGYRPRDGRCIDVDECLVEGTCAHGQCVNLDGSFRCSCYRGYDMAPDGKSCQDLDECEDPAVQCLGGECRNTLGSYECHCQTGFELINGTICKDMNECLNSEICSPNGECLNSQGSYFCICAPGFSSVAGGVSCQDVDECADKSLCSQGQCLNTEGSYRCLCENGFKHSQETDDCVDVDECKEYGDAICGTWRCQNSLGSYRCIMGCQPGFHWTPLGDCIDIDECANETLCGSHGFCENSDGSFRCLCDRGYESSPSGHYCIDVNECELMVAVCGTALCENVEGSFLCLCPSDHEEYDTEAGQCKPRAAAERKQCYYHISDVRLCDSVLAKNITKEECCCTVGAAWGDNCETYPCPIPGTVEYQEICPLGKGYIPQEDLLSGKISFTDMDECEIFGSEFCRNGQCLNTVPGYKCFCRTGYFYDSSRLECVDQDECQNEVYCINGECLNTEGSYHCFCSLPLVLDATGNRCVNFSSRADALEEYEIHLDVCWQTVADYICQDLLHGQQTTYTECCCRLGEAWGQNCALCPHRSSADFAFLCNGASEDSERGAELRERPRYEYGPGLEDPHYGLPSPYYNYLESEYGSPDAGFPRREPSSEFPGSPLHHGPARFPPRYLPGQTGLYEGFEGLQAEECGILNGCENGRCVRVPEGYTCDCFDGFRLDMARMACVDINECEEVGNPEPLCRGGTCENTEGSYRCQCLPGYVALARSHHCVPQTAQNPAAA